MGIKAEDGTVYTVDHVTQTAERAYEAIRILYPNGEMISAWASCRQEKRDAIFTAVVEVMDDTFEIGNDSSELIDRLLPNPSLKRVFKGAVRFLLDMPDCETINLAVNITGLEELDRLSKRIEEIAGQLEQAE